MKSPWVNVMDVMIQFGSEDKDAQDLSCVGAL